MANRNGPADAAASERDRFAAVLRAKIDPLALGLAVRDVRGGGLTASRGATDFGEYFTYFSFFLVISALMLVGNVAASNIVVRATPLSPAIRRFHTPSMSCPIGVIQPIPVMTTRFKTCIPSSPHRSSRRWLGGRSRSRSR